MQQPPPKRALVLGKEEGGNLRGGEEEEEEEGTLLLAGCRGKEGSRNAECGGRFLSPIIGSQIDFLFLGKLCAARFFPLIVHGQKANAISSREGRPSCLFSLYPKHGCRRRRKKRGGGMAAQRLVWRERGRRPPSYFFFSLALRECSSRLVFTPLTPKEED